MKLTIELVPATSFYNNVRSEVSKSVWDKIRKKQYSIANHVCQICGDTGKNQGYRHAVECHEVWQYNDETLIQELKGFIALCPRCHKVKHPGLAELRGEKEIVVSQLMKVNGMSRKQANEYIKDSFVEWNKRSQYEYDIVTDYVQEFIK